MNPFITSHSQPDPDMLIARLINPKAIKIHPSSYLYRNKHKSKIHHNIASSNNTDFFFLMIFRQSPQHIPCFLFTSNFCSSSASSSSKVNKQGCTYMNKQAHQHHGTRAFGRQLQSKYGELLQSLSRFWRSVCQGALQPLVGRHHH